MQNFHIKIIVLAALVATGILAGNGIIFIFAKIYGISIGTGGNLMDLLHDHKNLNFLKVALGINHLLTFIVAPMVFIKIFNTKGISQYLYLKHFDPRYLLYFPLALFTLYPMMSVVTFYMDKLALPEFLSQMDADAMYALEGLLQMHSIFDLAANLLLVGLIPAFGEEILFRGIIQKEITVRWSNPHKAIWLTAIIFSAFHFQAVGFPAKMMIGLILGYAYYYSGSLILSIILHALNNGLATVSLFFSGDHISQSNIQAVQEIPWSSVFISTAIFCGLMYNIKMLSSNQVTNE